MWRKISAGVTAVAVAAALVAGVLIAAQSMGSDQAAADGKPTRGSVAAR